MANTQLTTARNKQDDEFYTQYEDIANELSHYAEQLRGKTVLCPCDGDEAYPASRGDASKLPVLLTREMEDKLYQPGASGYLHCNFAKYLKMNQTRLGIKSIYVSGYNPETGWGVSCLDIDYSKYDVVITNPPFSIGRECVDCGINAGIDFIVLGSFNAESYRNIFKYLLERKISRGFVGDKSLVFKRPDGNTKAVGCSGYTTFKGQEGQKKMLDCNYSLQEGIDSGKVHKLYDIIEVDRCKYIPYDYEGLMAVPMSFFDVWLPEQFEILGNNHHSEFHKYTKREDGSKAFFRIIIKGTKEYFEVINN